MKRVTIKDTGAIMYVPDEYYERYKDEGLELLDDVDEVIVTPPKRKKRVKKLEE